MYLLFQDRSRKHFRSEENTLPPRGRDGPRRPPELIHMQRECSFWTGPKNTSGPKKHSASGRLRGQQPGSTGGRPPRGMPPAAGFQPGSGPRAGWGACSAELKINSFLGPLFCWSGPKNTSGPKKTLADRKEQSPLLAAWRASWAGLGPVWLDFK